MESNSTVMRIIIGLLLFVVIIHGWWQVAFLLGLFAIWKFNFFIEIIAVGIIYDALFGINRYSAAIIACVIFLVASSLKRILRRRSNVS